MGRARSACDAGPSLAASSKIILPGQIWFCFFTQGCSHITNKAVKSLAGRGLILFGEVRAHHRLEHTAWLSEGRADNLVRISSLLLPPASLVLKEWKVFFHPSSSSGLLYSRDLDFPCPASSGWPPKEAETYAQFPWTVLGGKEPSIGMPEDGPLLSTKCHNWAGNWRSYGQDHGWSVWWGRCWPLETQMYKTRQR